MENLSSLNVKCLANMPMLLDSLSISMGKIKCVINPYINEFKTIIEKRISPLGYIVNQNENGNIYALGYTDDYKYCHIEEVAPEIELRYILSFEQTKKRNPLKFRIDFGYICDETQNVIYYQLSEYSEKVNFIDEELKRELHENIPNDWEKSKEDDDSIYVQFTIDETLSNSKINECASVFKEYILHPFLCKIEG